MLISFRLPSFIQPDISRVLATFIHLTLRGPPLHSILDERKLPCKEPASGKLSSKGCHMASSTLSFPHRQAPGRPTNVTCDTSPVSMPPLPSQLPSQPSPTTATLSRRWSPTQAKVCDIRYTVKVVEQDSLVVSPRFRALLRLLGSDQGLLIHWSHSAPRRPTTRRGEHLLSFKPSSSLCTW